jgi:hypothetical protein
VTLLAHIGGLPLEEALPGAIALAMALRVWAVRFGRGARDRSNAASASSPR